MPATYNQAGLVYDANGLTYNGETYYFSPFPTAYVYISFTDSPYTANPTGWVDVTQYVRSITTHRGRSGDFEQFETGTAQLVLDNRDRRFDPFCTTSPYYPNGLTPRRQIKILGLINGTFYDVYRGYIAGWPVQWSQAGKDSTVTIQCFDALGLMANEVMPSDWADYYTRSVNPRRYWRGNDSRTTGIIRDQISNDLNMTAASTYPVFWEQPSLADGIPGTSAAVVSYAATGTATDSVPQMTFSGWVKSLVRDNTQVASFYYNIGNRSISWGIYQNGNFYAYWSEAAGPRYFTAQLSFDPTGAPFHLAVGGTNGNIFVWINGIPLSGTTTVTGTTYYPTEQCSMSYVNMQDFAIFPVYFGTDTITLLYNAGTARFSETTTARMQRLIGTTSYPAALQNFTTTPAATVAEIGSGRGVVPEMQLVADSEGGEIYVNKTGQLTTTNRTDVFFATRSATPQTTITDSGTGLRYGTELLIEYDADELKNDVVVTWSGDGELNLTSQTVVNTYGAATTTIETQLADPTSATQLAKMELGVESALVPRISPLDVSVNTAATDWATILGLELLDRVTFKRTPTVGNQFVRDALINGIDHQIEPGVWRTQLTLSMRYTSPETLGDPVLGRLGYNYLK